MSTQQEIAGLGHSNTYKKFRYTLLTKDDDPLTLTHAPDGWKSGELTFIRDSFYKGVMESFSTNSLEFVKEARDFIKTAYERGGIDYEITIYIDILVNSTFKYQRYFTGKLDLSTYKIDSIKVSCEIIPTGFQNVVINRDDVEVNLLSDKFIGGGEGSMEQITSMPAKVTIPFYASTINGSWDGTYRSLSILPTGHYVPFSLSFTEFNEGECDSQEVDSTTKLFTASQDRTLVIYGNVNLELMSNNGVADFSIIMRLMKNGIALYSFTDSYTGVEEASSTLEVDKTITVEDGDELYFTMEIISSTVDYGLYYNNNTMSFLEQIGDILPAIDVYSFYIYEAFCRALQLISGKSSPFYSELLGRVDSSPDVYVEDGDSSLVVITKGLLIREFNIDNASIIVTLKDLFTSINGINNIGLGFESGKVRVEKESYFYDITENPNYPTESQRYLTTQIIDISEHLNSEMISKEVLTDYYANKIESGYNNFEYENHDGLKEFNTKSIYSTPIKSVKSTLSIISQYRCDTQGVNKLREKAFSDEPNEDVRGDNDVFIFDVKRGGEFDFIVKTDEDFEIVSGGIDPSQSYNLNFTPRRNLERHGNRIRGMQLADGDEIQWISSGKNTKLITKKSTESIKYENGDILINDLDKSYWKPEAYLFDAPINESIISAIQSNSRGVIKIGENKYGWILEVQTNNDEEKGQFKLLRVDLNNVKITV